MVVKRDWCNYFLALAVVYLLIRPIVVQNLEPVIQDAVKEKSMAHYGVQWI